ncbi:MAG TPA: hypothetical protein VFH43_03125 [Candidatus Kapabacteria bacterium]|nr:hypothetical protein [Candidatus Kapabacteria bacterium]
MNEHRQVDPKITAKYMTWVGYSWIVLLALCFGAASADDTPSRTATVLWIGVILSGVMGFGSLFWTGYSREFRRVNPNAAAKGLADGSTIYAMGSGLFVISFVMEYLGEGSDLLPSLMKGLLMGLGVAGVMYLVYRKK